MVEQGWRGTIRIRLGKTANDFMANTLPALLRSGMLEEVPHRGSGVQRRFRLATRMQDLQIALADSNSDFDRLVFFLEKLRT